MPQERNFSNTWGRDTRDVKPPHTCVVREGSLSRGPEGEGQSLRLVNGTREWGRWRAAEGGTVKTESRTENCTA